MTIIFITLQHIPSIPQSYSSISNLYELSLHLHVTNFKCGIVQVLMNIVYKTHFLSTVLPNLSTTGTHAYCQTVKLVHI